MKNDPIDIIENMLNAVFEKLERCGCIPKTIDRNDLIKNIKNSLETVADKEQLVKEPKDLMKACQTAILCAISLKNNPALHHDEKALLNRIVDLVFNPTEKNKAEGLAKLRQLFRVLNQHEPNENKRLNDTQINKLANIIFEKLTPEKSSKKTKSIKEEKEEEKEERIIHFYGRVNKLEFQGNRLEHVL